MTITITSNRQTARVYPNDAAGAPRSLEVVVLPDGGYVVISNSFRLQRFDANGDAVGGPATLQQAYRDNFGATCLPDGNIATVWFERGAAFTQIITPSGVAVSSAVSIADRGGLFQYEPVITALEGGGYVVTWGTEAAIPGVPGGLVGRFFSASGQPVGEPFPIAPLQTGVTNRYDADIVPHPDGGFVIVWDQNDPNDYSGQDVFIQRYSATGQPIGTPSQVNGDTRGSLGPASVVLLADGKMVVHISGFSFRIYDSNAQPISDVIFHSPGVEMSGQVRDSQYIEALPNGGFVFRWVYSGGMAAQSFDAQGVPVGPAAVVAGSDVASALGAMAVLPDGSIVHAWSQIIDNRAYVVYSQSGTRTGSELSSARETAIGDAANDTFLAAPGTVGAGDVIDGGGGFDTLKLTAPDVLDLSQVSLLNLERIQGSDGDDVVILPNGIPAGVLLDSGGGMDTLLLSGSTSFGQLNLAGDWMLDAVTGSSLTVNVTSVAELDRVSGQNGLVTVEGLALTAEQRANVFSRGIDVIRQSDGLTFSADGEAWVNGTAPATLVRGAAPTIAGLENGNAVMVVGNQVVLIDPDGHPIGQPFIIAGQGYESHVAALEGGGFVVTWSDLNTPGQTDGFDARGQVFNAAGQPAGGIFNVTVATRGHQLSTMSLGLADGGFVVTWQGQDGGATGLRVFNADGSPRTDDIVIGNTMGNPTSLNRVAGGFSIGGGSIFADTFEQQTYSSQGVLQGGITLGIPRFSQVVRLENGTLVAVSLLTDAFGRTSTYLQLLDAAGQPLTPRTLLTSGNGQPTVAALDNGGFVVTYEANAPEVIRTVVTQRYDAQGLPIGDPETTTARSGFAMVAALPGSGYAVAWENNFDSTFRVVSALDYHVLTSAADQVLGGDRRTLVVAAADTVGAGDILIGGGGVDTLEMSSSGTLDLASATVFTGFENILGASGDDLILLTAERAAGLTIDGRGGVDTVSFEFSQTGVSGPVDFAVERLIGSAHADHLVVSAIPWLHAGAGDDIVTVAGSSGPNLTLNGGEGRDVLDLSSQSGVRFDLSLTSAQTLGGRTVTALGFEDIIGSAGADTLSGDAGANRLEGGGGNDVLSGAAGDDILFGGAGLDLLEGGDGNDILVGNADVFSQEADTLNGGAGDDLLYGEFTDTLNGGTGFDSLIAVNAYDWSLDMAATSIEYAVMDFGNDTVTAANQTVGVSIFTSGGNDDVTGSNFDDLIFGGVGDDVIRGGNGNDAIVGDLGVDQLFGGDGDDRIYFDRDDTVVSGGAGYDAGYITPASTSGGVVIDLAAASLEFLQDFAGGDDVVTGAGLTQGFSAYLGGGADTVTGSAFDDILWGEAGDDVLDGGDGADVVVGGVGSDRIRGGAGVDRLYGGQADGVRDTFIFEHTGLANRDFVYEFETANDRIDLSALGANTFANVSIAVSGGNSTVSLNGQLVCVVVGVTTLNAAHFIFAGAAPDDVPKDAAPPQILPDLDPGLSPGLPPLQPTGAPQTHDWLM